MVNKVSEIITGRKTFFICPDTLLIPQSYFEDYLDLGYECYLIDSDRNLPIDEKIDIILSVFKDSIVFFCIDTKIPDLNWGRVIATLYNKYKDSAKMGVLYTKRKSDEEKHQIEKLFLFDLGLQCGCVQLEYQKKSNFHIIERVLFANQAKGRRKSVRAICDNTCTFNFQFNNERIGGILNDISMTHFSITMPETHPMPQMYEKVGQVLIGIKGCYIRNDATLFLSRKVDNGILYIFMFIDETGQNGLTNRNRQLFLPKLYELLQDGCMGLVNQLFKTAKNNSDSAENSQGNL